MYTYIYIYISIHICIHTYVHICIHTYIYAYIYIYIYILYMYIHMYIYTYVHTWICKRDALIGPCGSVRITLWMYVCMHANVCVCTCVCMFRGVRAYTFNCACFFILACMRACLLRLRGACPVTYLHSATHCKLLYQIAAHCISHCITHCDTHCNVFIDIPPILAWTLVISCMNSGSPAYLAIVAGPPALSTHIYTHQYRLNVRIDTTYRYDM
jgi:hypothetical protein